MGLGLGLGLNKPKGLIYFQNQFSMEFDGVNDRITTDGADTVAQPTTYSFWCKSSETGQNKGVFGHGGFSIGSFHFNESASRPFLYLGAAYVYWVANDAQDDGEWHHWVVYLDTNNINNCKLYVDGVLQATSSVNTGSINAYTESLTIGSERQVGGNSFLGSMDEFAVFDRELTQAEITRMYNTYYTNNLVENGNFEEIGGDVVQNGDFEQIGDEEITNGTFDLGDDLVENGSFSEIGNEEVTNGDFSQTGSDLASGYDFTSGWNEFGAGTEITDSTSFVSQSGQGIYAGLGLVANKTYKIKIKGTQPSGGYFSIKAGTTGTSFGNISGTSFDETIYATPTVVTGVGNDFYIRLSTHPAGTTITISSLEVEEVEGWTLGGGWSIGNSVAEADGSTSTSNVLSQDLGLVATKNYIISFSSNRVGGTLFVKNGTSYQSTTIYTLNTGTGLEVQTFTLNLPSNSELGFYAFNYEGTIDNVSVKEVGQDWSIVNNTGTNTRIENNHLIIETDGTYTQVTQSNILEISKNYKLVYDVTATDGGDLGLETGGATSLIPSTIGTHTFYWTSNSTTFNLKRYGGALNITIDNVSVQETDWTVGTGWSIGDGLAINSGTGANSWLYQSKSYSAGKTYKISADVNLTSGSVRLGFNSVLADFITTTGSATYTYYLTLGSNQTFAGAKTGGGFAGSIDNISIKEVGQNWGFENGTNIGDNKAIISGDGSLAGRIEQAGVFASGKTYKITLDATINTGGGLNVKYGVGYASTIGSILTSGSYTFYYTAPSNQALIISRKQGGIAYDSSVTNISVQEVGQNWTFGDGWSTDGTKAIFSGTDYSILTTTYSPMIIGRDYKLTLKAEVTNGSFKFQTSGVDLITGSTTGDYSATWTATTSVFTIARAGVGVQNDFTIDNVVIQQQKHQATNLLVNSGDYQSANPLLTSTKSMFFDGIDDYLEVGDVGTVKSMSFWFNPDNDITASSSTERMFGFNGVGYTGIQLGIATGNFSGETLTVLEQGGGFNRTATTKEFDAGRWYHIVIAWNATASYFDIYVDGVLSTDLTSSAFTLTDWTDFKIGVDNTLTAEYNGKITEVGNWDRTLTALEVASLYNQGVPTNLLVNRNNYQSGNPVLFNTKQVDFDGTDDYMEIQDSSDLQLAGQEASFTFWARLDGLSGGDQKFLAKALTTGTDTSGYQIRTSNNDLIFQFFSGSWRTVASNSFFTDTNWVHATVTIDSSNLVKMYKNGVEVFSGNIGYSIPANSGELLFGARTPATPVNFLNGKMSQIGIFNSKLTADEVSSLYNHGLPIDLMTDQAAYQSSSNLVGYWRMGSGTNDGFPMIQDQLSPSLAHISTTNLFPYSEDFNNWSNFRSTLTPNETTSPDGTINAYLVEQDYPTTSVHGGLNKHITVTTGVKYTYSFFVKKKEYSFIELAQSATSSGNVSTWFDVENGVVGNIGASSTAQIEDFGNGWYRCSISFTSIFTGGRNFVLYLSTANGSSVANIVGGAYIWGAQLEEHPIATPYVKSNGIPGQRKSSTTNLVSYSEDFTQWNTTGNTSVSPNDNISPDGTQNASTVSGLTGSGSNDLYLIVGGNPASKTYSFSVYLKGSGTLRLQISNNVDQGINEIVTLTSDWKRHVATGTFNSTSGTLSVTLDDSGATATQYNIWGAQLEQQTQATPYIKTNGSPVTVEFYKENNYAEMVNLDGGANFSRGIQNGSPHAQLILDSDFTLTGTQAENIAGGYWTTGTGWSISGGKATLAERNGSSSLTSTVLKVTAGQTHKITVNVSATGVIKVRLYDSAGVVSYGLKLGENVFYRTPSSSNYQVTPVGLTNASGTIDNITLEEVNTGLQGYWKMGDGTNDEYPIIYDQTNPTLSSELVTGFTNGDTYPFTTFTTSGNNITSAIISSAFAGAVTNAISIVAGQVYKVTFDYNKNSGDDLRIVFSNSLSGAGSQASAYELISESGSYIKYFTITSTFSSGYFQMGTGASGDSLNASITNVSIKLVNGNPATMTAMPEGNITNQYPLTKLRNYYRMGDGILDSKFLSYPTDPLTDAPYIFQDQTSPNLAHIPTTNLITYSEDFTQSVWAKESGGTGDNPIVTSNIGISPDGTQNADKIVFDLNGGTSSSDLSQLRFSLSSLSGDYTNSIYLKSFDGASYNVSILDTNGILYAANITNEWQRFEYYNGGGTTSINPFRIRLRGNESTSDNATLLIWGAQLEAQSQATAYIKSDGVPAVRKSSTTNLFPYSEDFTNSEWNPNVGTTITPNYAISPNGSLNASRYLGIGTSGIGDKLTLNAVSHTLSFFVKSNNGVNQFCRLIGESSNVSSDLLVTTEWTRLSYTFTASGLSDKTNGIFRDSNNNDIDILIYGAQLEEQTQAETYAPTKGIPVTIDLFKENNYGHTQGGIIQKDVPRNS
jgi:hypothetical protein